WSGENMTLENDVDLSLWEPLQDIPNTTHNFRGYAMASVRDILYIAGGNSTTIHKSLLSYDVITRQWKTLPDMFYHRWGHQLAVLEGGRYLLAIGGWGYKSNAGNVNNGGSVKRRTSIMKPSLSKSTETGEKDKLEKLTSYEIYDVSKRQWTKSGVLNDSRRDFAISVDSASGKVYIFGGIGTRGALSSVEVYDPHVHVWRFLTPMPRPCRWCHALHVGNLIHIIEAGKKTLTYNTAKDVWSDDAPDETYIPRCPKKGNIYSSTPSCSDGQVVIIYWYAVAEVDGQLTKRWMIAHIAKKRSRSWTALPPADEFVYYRTVVANGKLVIAIGNSLLAFQVVDDAIDDSTSSHSSAGSSTCNESTSSKSDGEGTEDNGTWKPQSEMASKPRDFRCYAVVSAGSKVYISGGFSGDSTIYRSFHSYNVKAKKWKKLPNMTHHRLGHRMAVSGDGSYIYVLGGGDGKTLRSLGIDIYNVKKKTWTAGPAMNCYRLFFGVTVCLGKLLVFGGVGSNNGNELGLVELYDPETNCWKYVKPMPEARGVCNVIAIGHIIYVFGTPLQKVLAYDANAGEWLKEVASDALPPIPPGGCVCASSSFDGGEVLVVKYPLIDQSPPKQRRAAHVYNAPKKAWTSVHLLDDHACYSAAVANDKIVVVTPQNQLMACTIPKVQFSSREADQLNCGD
ncbi:hypothetical protein ACHAXR_003609, partial [Thalassiosira sp. AJA248-18]